MHSNYTLELHPKKMGAFVHPKGMYKYVHSSLIQKSPKTGNSQLLISKWMHIHTREYFTAKKQKLQVYATWRNLRDIMFRHSARHRNTYGGIPLMKYKIRQN